MKVHELFPYLRVKSASKAVDFYKQAFGVTEKFRLVEPGGRVGHVELDFGVATLMLSDEFPEMGILSPETTGSTSLTLHLHVDDADAVIEKAVAAGAKLIRPPQNHFYGERSGTVRDPFGHEWNIGHQLEEVTPEEMQRRYDALFEPGSK